MNSVHLEIPPEAVYYPHSPSKKQWEFLQLDCLEALYGGAAGGGKSDALLMAALRGIQHPDYRAILFRRTYEDLSLPGAIMDRSHSWWRGTPAKWEEQAKTWHFPSGARIRFGYLDGPNDKFRYQSAEFHFIGIDEATQFKEQDALYLLSRLRRTRDFPDSIPLRWRAATNPGGVGHAWIQKRYHIPDEGCLKTIVIRDKTTKTIRRAFVPAFAQDNPGLNVEEYMATLDLLDPVTRAQLSAGKWLVDSTGLVYYCYDPRKVDIDSLPELRKGERWRYVLGCDYAASTDKTSFSIHAYNEFDPVVYQVWNEEHERMSPSETALRTEELSQTWGGFDYMVGDAGGLGAAVMLEMQKHFAIPIQAAEKQHKAAYIRMLNGEMANGRYRVLAKNCRPWCEQAKTLLWKNEEHLIENQSQHNDATDSALYGWRACRHYSAATRVVRDVAQVDDIEQSLIDQRRREELFGGVDAIWD